MGRIKRFFRKVDKWPDRTFLTPEPQLSTRIDNSDNQIQNTDKENLPYRESGDEGLDVDGGVARARGRIEELFSVLYEDRTYGVATFYACRT